MDQQQSGFGTGLLEKIDPSTVIHAVVIVVVVVLVYHLLFNR